MNDNGHDDPHISDIVRMLRAEFKELLGEPVPQERERLLQKLEDQDPTDTNAVPTSEKFDDEIK